MLVFLETQRLVLRRFTVDDADNLVKLDADPGVMRFVTGGVPTSRDEIEKEFLPAFLGYYERYEGSRPRRVCVIGLDALVVWLGVSVENEDALVVSGVVAAGVGDVGEAGLAAQPRPRQEGPVRPRLTGTRSRTPADSTQAGLRCTSMDFPLMRPGLYLRLACTGGNRPSAAVRGPPVMAAGSACSQGRTVLSTTAFVSGTKVRESRSLGSGDLVECGEIMKGNCMDASGERGREMSGMTDVGPPAVGPGVPQPPEKQADREWARKRVERKRRFWGGLVAYVVVNLFLIGAWAVTGFGDFWPGWVLAGWGVLVVLDAWNVYFRRPLTEDDIDRELRNRPSGR